MATEHRNPAALLPCRRRRARSHSLLLPVTYLTLSSDPVSEAHMDEGEAHRRSAPAAARRVGVDTFHGVLLHRSRTWRPPLLKLGPSWSSCSSPRRRYCRGSPGPPRKQQLLPVVLRYTLTRARYDTSQQPSLPLTWHYCWRDDRLVWLPVDSFPGDRGQWRGAGDAVGAGGPNHRRQLQRRAQPAGVRRRRWRLRRVIAECMHISAVLALLLSALSFLSFRICPFVLQVLGFGMELSRRWSPWTVQHVSDC